MPPKRTQKKKRREPERDRECQGTSNQKRSCRLINRIDRERATDRRYCCNKRTGAEKPNETLISCGDPWWCRIHSGTAQHFSCIRRGWLLIKRQLKLLSRGTPISITERHAGRPAGAFDAGQSSRYEQ